LQQTVDDTPNGDVLIFMGDMNPKVVDGESTMTTGRFELGIRNEAGKRLMEFCEANSLKIMNTVFKQPRCRMNTWTSSPHGKYINQIDYIMCRSRWTHTLTLLTSATGSRSQS